MRKSNKKCENLPIIKVLSNHNLIILQFCLIIKDYILYQIMQTASTSRYYFSDYGKITDNWQNSWIEELQSYKPKSPCLASSVTVRKWRVLIPCITWRIVDLPLSKSSVAVIIEFLHIAILLKFCHGFTWSEGFQHIIWKYCCYLKYLMMCACSSLGDAQA